MATILIVDDHPDNREFLMTLLGHVGHTLLEATDGAEALAIVRAARPELVIADLFMPIMDGYEFARQLRADPAIAQTKVIYCTAAYLESEARALAQSVGVGHILATPAAPGVILDTVADALAHPTLARAPGTTVPPAEDFDHEYMRLLTNKLAHKVDELALANTWLAALLDLSQRLATVRNPAELLQTCCDAARSIIGAQSAAIQIFDDDGQSTRHFCASGLNANAAAQPLEIGLLARLRAAGHPLRLRDIGADMRNSGFQARHPPMGSFLGVPIESAAQRYGVLYLTDKLGGEEFSAEEEQIAITLAAQTAIAYENAQRYDALRNHAIAIEQEMAERTNAEERLRLYTHRLETLHAIDWAILPAQSPQAIAQAALQLIRQLVPFRRASIMTFDFAVGEAEIWATETNLPTDLHAGMRISLAEFLGIDTLRQGRPFLVHDLRELEKPAPLYQHLLKDGIRSYMSMPIIVQTDLIGTINIAPQQLGGFAPEHIDIAREVAAQLAVAIQNLRLFEQVRVGRERLQRLSQQLVRTQESERRKIARELHDEIGQSLTAAQLNLQVLIGITDLSELPARLEDSLALIDRVLQQVRTLSLDLRPSMLDDLGLVPALRWYVNRQAERAGFSVELHMDQTPERFPPDLETTCFRIAQEALNNIVRYAQAKNVVVELHQRDTILHLTISDDGVGFDVAAALRRAATGRSLGLVSMQERAVLLGGMIQFDSAPDRGTTIFVELPLATPLEAARQIERRSNSR